MGEIKLVIKSDSMKELMDDIVETMEEMGSIVVKGVSELPDSIEELIKSKGMFLYKPDDGLPNGMLNVLLGRELDDIVDFMLENKEIRNKILEVLKDKGFELKNSDEDEKQD